MNPESIIKYPLDFPIKVMGEARDQFAQTVVEIVLRHAPDFDAALTEMKLSKNGNYLSVTCTILATSREQLDNLYRELTANPMVKFVL